MLLTEHWTLDTGGSKGFTLLELLVVLAIIAILTAIGTVSFTAAQKRARDSQRKSDLKVIASALENYFQKNKTYPDSSLGSCAAGAAWYCSNSGASPWIPQLTSAYIKKLPADLRNTAGTICQTSNNSNSGLTYAYHSSNDFGLQAGKQYILTAKAENDNDPEAGSSVRYGNATFTYPGCFAISSP